MTLKISGMRLLGLDPSSDTNSSDLQEVACLSLYALVSSYVECRKMVMKQ